MTYGEYCKRRANLCNLHMDGHIDEWELEHYLSALACTFAGIPS